MCLAVALLRLRLLTVALLRLCLLAVALLRLRVLTVALLRVCLLAEIGTIYDSLHGRRTERVPS